MRRAETVPDRRTSVSAGQGQWWAWEDLNLRPHPYQVSRAQRCADRRFPRSLATPIGDSSISPRPLWRPGLLMLGTSTTGRSSPGPRVAPTPVSTPRERGHGPTPTQTAAAGDPDPGRRGAGGQRPHGRAAAPCSAHRRAARPPPTRDEPPDEADAAGVVSGLPGRTLSGQSWWQVAQPRASSPAAPNPAPGLTSPPHHLTTPRAGVRPQTQVCPCGCRVSPGCGRNAVGGGAYGLRRVAAAGAGSGCPGPGRGRAGDFGDGGDAGRADEPRRATAAGRAAAC